MEGEEKKSGVKRRSKPVGIGLASDDDEPIGSLLKVKRARNSKKVKVEAREEKPGLQNEDLGGMDDTLASFRKKLKGPKKDIGSGAGRVRSSALNVMDSCNGSVEDEVLDEKSPSKIAENGQDLGDGGSGATIDKGYENKCKGKVRKSKSDYAKKRIESCIATDDGIESLESDCTLSKDQKEADMWLGEGSSHSADENLEDSLSAFFKKAHSGSSKKSRTSPHLREKSGNQTLDGGLSPSPECVSEGFHSMAVRRPLPASAPDQRFDDSLCQVPKCREDHHDVAQQLDSVPPNTNDTVRSRDDSYDDTFEAVAEDPALHSPPLGSLTEQNHRKLLVDLSSSNVQEGHAPRVCGLNEVCDGSTKLCNCLRVKDRCYASCQRAALGTQNFKDGLKHCSMEKASTCLQEVENPNSISASKQMEEIHGFREGEFNSGLNDSLDKKAEGDDNGCCKNSSKDMHEQPSGRNLDVSSTEKSSGCHMKVEEGVKSVNGIDCDQSPKGSQQILLCSSDSAFVTSKVQETCSNFDGPNTRTEEPDVCDISKPSSGGLHRNEFAASSQMCSSALNQDRPSDTSKGICVRAHDHPILDVEANEASSPSISPDKNVSYLENVVCPSNSGKKDNKLSADKRAIRKPKRRRHRDMAYEGDADWENLMHEQGFLESHQVIDSDRPSRVQDKFGSSSNIATDAENGGAAAVSAGLKAHAVGPVERIKFKEVLKRKGGLQEYLEYRNQILGLWNKDVSRILPVSDCGVSDTPSEDESSRASLIREIYAFLDRSGYINVGIASKKEKAEPSAKHNYKLLEEKKFEASSGASLADSEEGVSFILGQIKTTGASLEGKNGLTVLDENQTSEAKKDKIPLPTRQEEADNYQENGSIDAKPPNGTVSSDIFCTHQTFEVLGSGKIPVLCPELTHDSYNVQSASTDHTGGNLDLQCDSEARKRIIIIGAGPAGLTAARHLQRQGFSVTVLEARSRIGGRVYTDRSSLSVPVDLGASIITGVEADVDTERRPDPSSLICAQLGLELTVLNSDCPLYDIVTGHKVPADLDEALEAEYNSLLDDMVLLVAQKGERAMRMSLEDGLEYALSRRRMARLGIDGGETEVQNRGDATFASKKLNVDVRVREKRYSEEEILSPLERRVMNWHFAHLEYGCAALLKEVSLPYWNQDDVYGGFGGAHCMIKGGYSNVVESLGEGLSIHLNHVVTDVSYTTKDSGATDGKCNNVKVSTSNGGEFSGDAVLITVPLGCLKAEAIKFSPPLPQWKLSSIQRLGFGVLNKVVLEFPKIFWDDSVDYFGATAEDTDMRGQCFMFWNVRKTVGAPVLIALLVGKAAIDGQTMSSSDHISHALMVLRKLFGESSVPNPVASVVTDWGRDPFSYGAYSYVAVGASGEDYDILGRPVDNCLFFAGEATCKEHPDTVGGAMMSGLREAVRIIDILQTGNDNTAEVEAMEAAQRQTDSERDEVRDITTRLEAVELSNALYTSSLDGTQILTREALLQDMFFNAKTTAGRLHLAKELLHLPVETLKSFAGTRKGLTTLNSWILDSMGKDGTQLLRHCVRLLVRVSTDLLAVRLSGIGKTVKEKVCVHTSRDIRAIASQLVNVWLEVFRKEKTSNSRLKLLRQTAIDSSRSKIYKDPASVKPPLRTHHTAMDNKGSFQVPASAGCQLPSNANVKKVNGKPVKLEAVNDSRSEVNSSKSGGSVGKLDAKVEEDNSFPMSEEEQAAFAAAEAARAAALAAAEAYASSGAKGNTSLQLPKIPSFHKFARREQYAQMDESDLRRKWSGGVLGRQDCLSEIDSRNCRVREWSVDFSAACVNLDSSKMSVDNLSQRSHSNEVACQLNFREHSGESVAVDSSLFTKAWVDSAGSEGIKDSLAIERWQSQAAAADSDFFHRSMHIKDEEDSNTSSKLPAWKHGGRANESSVSQVTINKELQPRGADRIKQAVVDYVASLLMPLYKARKIDKEGYKSIMKKTATKVMEQTTDAEKAMVVYEFLDSKRKNKIRSFVDKLIERHMKSR